MNPARDLGLRLVTLTVDQWRTNVFTNLLPYLVGPMIGGPIGAMLAEGILTTLQ